MIYDIAGVDMSGQLSTVPVEFLARNPNQPRRHFDLQALEELAGSIREQGIIMPLLVRPNPDRKSHAKYEIVAGERRWRAAQMAGLMEVPCFVRELNDEQRDTAATTENTSREGLTAIEEAVALKRQVEIVERRGERKVHESIATVLGVSRVWVTNGLRLLQLSAKAMQLAEQSGKALQRGHLLPLVGLSEKAQVELISEALSKKLTARDIERLAKRRKLDEAKPDDLSAQQLDRLEREQRALDLALRNFEKLASEAAGSPVQIEREHGHYKLEISCFNTECLEGVLERFGVKVKDEELEESV